MRPNFGTGADFRLNPSIRRLQILLQLFTEVTRYNDGAPFSNL